LLDGWQTHISRAKMKTKSENKTIDLNQIPEKREDETLSEFFDRYIHHFG